MPAFRLNSFSLSFFSLRQNIRKRENELILPAWIFKQLWKEYLKAFDNTKCYANGINVL